MKFVKIYGQKRTGTNYFSGLVRSNFKDIIVFMNVGGWKHGELIEYPNEHILINHVDHQTKARTDIQATIQLFRDHDVNFIILVKNPYLWVKSLSKFENKGLTVEYAKKSIMIWNKYYSNYMDFIKKGRAYLVKYELLIKYPVEEMNKLKEYFRLEKKELTYAFEKKKMRPNDDSTIGCTHNFLFQNSDYYREESKYIPQLLSKEIIDVINEELDKSLMEFYGYDYFYHE